ncbi:hypothetical protein TVAG_117200 [Trichomonas vaginalis G3]|uniref:DUF3447 domain-containing protein n=1 Tax=Trichomonas vaginalis (strain ATCC PRA-98 / G3) TaxID=412133 RepID=A2E3R0_TRIV3|nr:protein ubiquitination [Trichomonas vaginalis G3]EAY12698.1 hypothetical protein TVAG_117200 [Trichomonas vaginalis G3]KAI5517540.1 protein ubiquitination [Trichomonas vaginalis G3]|eukprot:XP_001324921.1 hypothetical protein [Trichomonas vaginalis G3]
MEYIKTWDEIYTIDSEEESSINILFSEIEDNLINTGYFTAQQLIKKIKEVSETRLRYRHAYIAIMEKLAAEYHCENCLNISFLSKYDNIIKNTYKEAILNDDDNALSQFLKSEKLNLIELLENCCLNGAENCFKLLRKNFKVKITKKCLKDSFIWNNKYIIQECLKVQKPDVSTFEAGIRSHDMENYYDLLSNNLAEYFNLNPASIEFCCKHLNLQLFILTWV